MTRTIFDPIVRVAAVAAAFAVSACASAKRVSDPAPVKPARVVSLPAVPPPAATSASAPASVNMPTIPLTRVGGVVVSEDTATRTLTIKDYGGRTRVFRVAGAASVTQGGDEAAIGLDGIAVGSRVRLKVGGDVAASVHVMVKPAQ